MKRLDRNAKMYCPLTECGSNFNNVCSATEQTGIAPVGMPNVGETEGLVPDMWNNELSVMPVRYTTPSKTWRHWRDCPFARGHHFHRD